jgi:hypothetical protein
MIRNYRVEIENVSVWDCFLSGFATVTCKLRTTWQTLLNFQQMMILTCMPHIKKTGSAGYFYFSYSVLRTHPVLSDFQAFATITLAADQRKYPLKF